MSKKKVKYMVLNYEYSDTISLYKYNIYVVGGVGI